MPLTKTAVEQLRYTKPVTATSAAPAQYLWDEKMSGFGVRVYPSGRKSFLVTYRTATGTKRFDTIGEFGVLSVEKAREIAQDKLYAVRQGKDPQQEKQQKRGEMTFKEFSDHYMEHFKHHKRSWKKDEERLRLHILPRLEHKKLSEITATELHRLHISIKEKTHGKKKKKLSAATANRVAALLKHMFGQAVAWGFLPSSPASGVKLFAEAPPRNIVLTPDECHRLLAACDADENEYAGALFKLAMFTGRRVGEIVNAKRVDFDLARSVWTVPMTKAGEQQFVPLDEVVKEIIGKIKEIAENPYLLPGVGKNKPLRFYQKAWKRILKRARIPYFPPHGLRHSYASLLVASGVPLHTVGGLLGHKSSLTTLRYAHHRQDDLKQATATLPYTS